MTWKAQPEKGGLEQLVPVPAESLGGARIYFGLWRGLGLVLLFGLCAKWGYHSQAAPGLIFLQPYSCSLPFQASISKASAKLFHSALVPVTLPQGLFVQPIL